jgi:hypothetical protein
MQPPRIAGVVRAAGTDRTFPIFYSLIVRRIFWPTKKRGWNPAALMVNK